jgi:hypothetical protein
MQPVELWLGLYGTYGTSVAFATAAWVIFHTGYAILFALILALVQSMGQEPRRRRAPAQAPTHQQVHDPQQGAADQCREQVGPPADEQVRNAQQQAQRDPAQSLKTTASRSAAHSKVLLTRRPCSAGPSARAAASPRRAGRRPRSGAVPAHRQRGAWIRSGRSWR